jgi:hypothetical protein
VVAIIVNNTLTPNAFLGSGGGLTKGTISGSGEIILIKKERL